MLPVVILGGGVTGLGCAWKLSQAKIPVIVLEKNIMLGGLSGTVQEGPYRLDFGPHSFFTEDYPIQQTVLELLASEKLITAPRQVKFRYQGRFLDYPLTASSVLLQMGFWEGLHCALSFLKSSLRPKNQAMNPETATLEEWAKSQFGSHLYKVFFKPYTEQFWKMPASELSARCIPSHTRLSFLEALRHLIGKRLPAKNPSLMDREKLPTYYPENGYGVLPEKLAQETVREGGQIETGATVTGLDFSNSDTPVVYCLKNGESFSLRASHIISTLPLTLLPKFITPQPSAGIMNAAASLLFRPLIFLGMVIERQNVLPCSYLYTLHRPYNRITEMNKFSEATSPAGENIIAVEIPCRPKDLLLQATREELFEHCIEALTKDGILNRREVKKLILAKSAYAYPVYTKNYNSHLNSLRGYFDSLPNFKTLGRSGEFRYMDADQCLRHSFDYVESLLPKLVPAKEAEVSCF